MEASYLLIGWRKDWLWIHGVVDNKTNFLSSVYSHIDRPFFFSSYRITMQRFQILAWLNWDLLEKIHTWLPGSWARMVILLQSMFQQVILLSDHTYISVLRELHVWHVCVDLIHDSDCIKCNHSWQHGAVTVYAYMLLIDMRSKCRRDIPRF